MSKPQKSIRLTILNRPYPIKIDPEDEEMMYKVTDYINQRFGDYRKQLNGQPETTITAMAVLSIAVELFQEKKASSGERVNSDSLNRIGEKLSIILQEFDA